MIDLSRNIDLITEKIIKDDIALVIIDPLMALLGGSVDSHRDQDIRSITSPLAKLAEETNTTILMVRHPNKSQGGSAIMRGGGSIGIIGAARVGLTLGKDPEDDNKRVLAVAKNNLAKDNLSFSFQIVKDETFGTGRIEWLGISSVTADDLYREPNRGERTQIEEAMDLIRDILKDGRLGSKEIFSIAKSAGISETPVRDAMKRLKLVYEREGFGLATRTYWSFPALHPTDGLPNKAISGTEGNEWSAEPILPNPAEVLGDKSHPWAK